MTGTAATPGRRRVRLVTVGAGLGLWLVVAVTGAVPAAAHSELTSSTPAAGARLTRPPTRVVLRFTEDVDPRFAAVTLTVDDAAPVAVADRVDGDTVTVTPPSTPGRWKVAYRVVSGDGHPITGNLTFTVAAARPTAGTPTRTAAPPGAPTRVAPSPTPTAAPPAAQSASTPPSPTAPGTPTAAGTGSATPSPTAADAARNAWWKWPLVGVVALTLVAAPAAAALRGLGTSTTGFDEPDPPDGPGPADDGR